MQHQGFSEGTGSYHLSEPISIVVKTGLIETCGKMQNLYHLPENVGHDKYFEISDIWKP